ncbi:aldo/keto reductase [Pelomyxa schiedti]|nr:aldo/keto reductase [Pelomyxa schiedti]
MGMSAFYTDPVRTDAQVRAESMETMALAESLGVNFFDTSDIYGVGENEKLVGSALGLMRRSDVVLATKCGFTPSFGLDGSPEYVIQACEASLTRLNTPYIDLYYLHRVDPKTPIEETMKAMAQLYKSGKIRACGLSEVSPATLRRAQAVFPVTAVQSEYSLWTRYVEPEVLPTCRELGTALVAYSPIGRGFLSGTITDRSVLAPTDWRRDTPRFSEENLTQNLALVAKLKELAESKGCTASQLALAWCLAQGKDVIPIPGTKRVKYLKENVAATSISLSKSDLTEVESVLSANEVHGERYPPAFAKMYL